MKKKNEALEENGGGGLLRAKPTLVVGITIN